jgi:hypothetical protein
LNTFHNLFPEDSPRIIQRSRLVFKSEKWREVTEKGEERTASGVYNFIVDLQGIIFIRKVSAGIPGYPEPISHVDLAMGRDVKYAGQIYFSGRNNRGILRRWNNGSGHYRPHADFMVNSGLPGELFESYMLG